MKIKPQTFPIFSEKDDNSHFKSFQNVSFYHKIANVILVNMSINSFDRKHECNSVSGLLLPLLLLCLPTTKASICMPLTGKVEVWIEKKICHGP